MKYFRHAPIETINSASGNQVERADSELGAFFRKMKTLRGPASEATATARKIARIYYTLVKKGCACGELFGCLAQSFAKKIALPLEVFTPFYALMYGRSRNLPPPYLHRSDD